MPVWLVKVTWSEDDAEASEQWEVNAENAHEAVRDVATRLRFPPHHVEARLSSAEGDDRDRRTALHPGEMRRIPPG